MLKISPINGLNHFSVKKSEKQSNITTNPITTSSNPTEVFTSGVPRSYINFKGKIEDAFKFGEDAKQLINRAKKIAIDMGHDEITPYHIIAASINETEDNIKYLSKNQPELLSSGQIASISTLNKLANNSADKNMLSSKNDFNYFLEIVNWFKQENNEYLDALPVNNDIKGKERDIDFSEDLKKEFKTIQEKVKNFDAYMLLGTAFNVNSFSGVEYTSDFIQDFKSLTYYKNSQDIIEQHLKHYDAKAIDVWNKLALGSNLFVTYNDKTEGDRLQASLVHTIDAKKHGNFNSDNTLPYLIADTIQPKDLIDEIQSIQEIEPDKHKIFMVNIDSLVQKSTVDENGEISLPVEIFALPKVVKDNVHFIFFQNKDVYYQAQKDSTVKKLYSDYINYSIPPMHTFEAQKVLATEKQLTKDIKTPFTKEARDKAVFYADKIEGVFPDKAVDLMKRISSYYGDSKKRINIKNVDEFASIAKDLFNKDADSSSVIYDTGKDFSSLYGKETVKKDLEAIVRQIKTGKIGTRGYIMYSQDEEAGSGKRYTAQALAGEAKVPYMEIASADYATVFEDENGIKNTPAVEMHRIFSEIKKAAEQNENKTAILFINNFEDFAFSGYYHAGYKQAMAQMEKEMSRAEAEKLNILVIGSTEEDYAQLIPTVARGFNQNISIDSPAFNKASRKEIITNRLKECDIQLEAGDTEEKDRLIQKLVKLTEYMSFVEIKTMIDKAKQITAERGKNKSTMGDFIESYLQISTGRTSRPEMPEFNKRATTSHECGHAVNLEVMGDILKEKGQPWHQSTEVNFITLDKRGQFLGAVFEGRKDNTDYPLEALFTDIVCSYGGYSCEKKFFNMDGSCGIGQDLEQATKRAKYGIEYYGIGYNTGKISNAAGIKSGKYYENVYKDMEVILKNAQTVSDLITDTYKGFNEWFTDKYSKLIGTDDCMIDGDDFRAALALWKTSQPESKKEEFEILSEMVMDIIKATKKGKIYGKLK